MTDPVYRLMLGGFAGAMISLIAFLILKQAETPVASHRLIAPTLLGVLFGSLTGVIAGKGVVSFFWLYFVFYFGLIAIIPWWDYGEHYGFLPLATPYFIFFDEKTFLFLFIPHSLISVFLALLTVLIHKKVLALNVKK